MKNLNKNDSLLINEIKEGNEEAFKILMLKYQMRIYSTLYSYTKSKETAEDLTQQTFIKVWKKIDMFKGESSFYTWLYRVAINLAKNHYASSAFKKERLNISSEDKNYEFLSNNNIEEEHQLKESLNNINIFISSMPEEIRTCFILREKEGKSYDEIAKILNIPIGTVRSRIYRAREMILDRIKHNGEIV